MNDYVKDFAWTPGGNTYQSYPPYMNLTGNHLTVRGTEKLNGPYPQPGDTVSIDLPTDQITALTGILLNRLLPSDHTTKDDE